MVTLSRQYKLRVKLVKLWAIEEITMTTSIDYDKVTAESIASIAVRGVNDQKRIDHACELSFAGQTLVAPADSILGGAIVILAERAEQFKKDKAAGKVEGRFQAANMLATMISRWLKKQSRFEGRRVSVRTGKTPSVALVERKDNNHKPKDKGAKGARGASIKSVKDLSSLIAYAIDHYGYEAVAAAVVKAEPQKDAA